MKMLEKSKDKIQQICDVLRQETLQPAEVEAEAIIVKANQEAKEIVAQARNDAEALIASAKESMAKEEAVYKTALIEASKLSIERLKQEITEKLFNSQLEKIFITQTADPKVVERLIEAIIGTIRKDGLSADFSALIPKEVSVESVNALIKKEILDLLREKSVIVGDFKGGAKLKLHDKKMTIEVTDEAIVALLEQHLRKDFRKWLFSSNGVV